MSETPPDRSPGLPPSPAAELSAMDWLRALWGTWQRMDQRNLGLIAAGVAFYAFLSLFPAISAVIAIWGYWADPAVISEQMELLHEMIPEQAYTLLATQVNQLISTNRSTLQWASVISILVAIWSSRASVAALIRGLNAIAETPHRENAFRRLAVAVLLTALLVIVALVAFAAVVILPAALAFLGLPIHIELAVSGVKWLILLAVVFFAIALIYRYGPNRRRARMRWFTPGALLALLAWAAGSFLLTSYVRNFDRLNEVYGSLGAVVALLLWFYVSALVTLLGAQLNGELERLRAARKETPATVEP
ncbi:YihY/virulence factor BrkB family protein [Salipiger sp. P9]|uniref:YihY/virulence factor BrkB family protein n=1 Tax=Salipiger pentaromativorans TaxID=2943193 RepID=UPI002157FC90|nr:YihY/virulence factor BrkB family protein [Salipiger pentaromativorans]MCR8549477.1 YihY/virulence factor BrkB family protein [Salipiger pentaromativorans]